MREYVIGPENFMWGDPLVALCAERGFEQVLAGRILVAPLHELEEVRHVTEGQVVRKNP